MWTRKELKQRAKEALRRNYWKIVLVAFLTSLIMSGPTMAGSATGSSSGVTAGGGRQEEPAAEYRAAEESADDAQALQTDGERAADDGREEYKERRMVFMISVVAFTVAFCVAFIVIYVITALLYNPFSVGVSRFMLKSIDDRAQVKEIAFGYDHSYKNVVKTMFHMDMRTLAWSLLFIIPGICKAYQYRMVSYILAERPDMEWRDALRLSTEMMQGEKWRAFVLDLSFVPWRLLSLITCGVAGIFYADAYIYLTKAALYRRLCELRDQDALRTGEAVDDGI